MALKLDHVAREYRKSRTIKEDNPHTQHVLRKLLVRGLPPRQRQALQILHRPGFDDPLTAAELAEKLDISHTNACNVLNRLCELHLARREPVVGDTGLHYDYYYVNEGFDLG